MGVDRVIDTPKTTMIAANHTSPTALVQCPICSRILTDQMA
jgi:hypothetical protein